MNVSVLAIMMEWYVWKTIRNWQECITDVTLITVEMLLCTSDHSDWGLEYWTQMFWAQFDIEIPMLKPNIDSDALLFKKKKEKEKKLEKGTLDLHDKLTLMGCTLKILNNAKGP